MFLLIIGVGYVQTRHVRNANKVLSRTLFVHNSVVVRHKKQTSQNGSFCWNERAYIRHQLQLLTIPSSILWRKMQKEKRNHSFCFWVWKYFVLYFITTDKRLKHYSLCLLHFLNNNSSLFISIEIQMCFVVF